MKHFTYQLISLVLLCCCVSLTFGWLPWSRQRSNRKPPTPKPAPRAKPTLGPLQVSRGQVTFEAEGNDNPRSRYFSRVPHVPSGSSGITLGRGYDMKEREKSAVQRDLESCGIDKTYAQKFSEGAGLRGQAARDFLKTKNLQNFRLNHQQQKELFYIAYDPIAADAKRLATKSDVVQAYGTTDWNRLNRRIKDVVVDLRYRGDYTPTTRRKIQKAVARNDLVEFKKLMSDYNYWVKTIKVPEDRFRRRIAAL